MSTIPPGYEFTRPDFATLLLRTYYPERTNRESAVIRDYLLAHLAEFDKVDFSVRVGQGTAPDPNAPASANAQAKFVSQKRIDILAWTGSQPTIIEVKVHVTPASLGQILTYRHLWLLENPDALEPRLVVVGRSSDDDTNAALTAHGISIYLYPEADTSTGVAPSGV